MPRFLDTTGNTTLGIGLCDRCQKKFPLGELRPDGNTPGLMVCKEDWDELDRYRLPQRKPESITLRVIRPDTDVSLEYQLDADGNPVVGDDGYYVLA